ncbi:hypothetical protein AB834_04490 [PVC group bacterium (ex Bugula neritina AB1)]|nr:hypothetical protein AB834_04490 [PVC group bacterium (ex Bugula neritina AB1)]
MNLDFLKIRKYDFGNIKNMMQSIFFVVSFYLFVVYQVYNLGMKPFFKSKKHEFARSISYLELVKVVKNEESKFNENARFFYKNDDPNVFISMINDVLNEASATKSNIFSDKVKMVENMKKMRFVTNFEARFESVVSILQSLENGEKKQYIDTFKIFRAREEIGSEESAYNPLLRVEMEILFFVAT